MNIRAIQLDGLAFQQILDPDFSNLTATQGTFQPFVGGGYHLHDDIPLQKIFQNLLFTSGTDILNSHDDFQAIGIFTSIFFKSTIHIQHPHPGYGFIDQGRIIVNETENIINFLGVFQQHVSRHHPQQTSSVDDDILGGRPLDLTRNIEVHRFDKKSTGDHQEQADEVLDQQHRNRDVQDDVARKVGGRRREEDNKQAADRNSLENEAHVFQTGVANNAVVGAEG